MWFFGYANAHAEQVPRIFLFFKNFIDLLFQIEFWPVCISKDVDCNSNKFD